MYSRAWQEEGAKLIETFTGIKTDVSYLRVFGCTPYMNLLRHFRGRTFSNQAGKVMMIGYIGGSDTFWIPATVRIVVSRYVGTIEIRIKVSSQRYMFHWMNLRRTRLTTIKLIRLQKLEQKDWSQILRIKLKLSHIRWINTDQPERLKSRVAMGADDIRSRKLLAVWSPFLYGSKG